MTEEEFVQFCKQDPSPGLGVSNGKIPKLRRHIKSFSRHAYLLKGRRAGTRQNLTFLIQGNTQGKGTAMQRAGTWLSFWEKHNKTQTPKFPDLMVA